LLDDYPIGVKPNAKNKPPDPKEVCLELWGPADDPAPGSTFACAVTEALQGKRDWNGSGFGK